MIRASVVMVVTLLVTGSLYAQQPRAAVVPEAITVGDVFHAAVRVELPAGSQLAAPDSLTVPADVENAGRPVVTVDTTGARTATVSYPLAAWRPGTYELPPVTVSIVGDGGARDVVVQLPSFTVRSVLPSDTTGIEPREAKDVLGANRVWWPILLALLLAALVAIALYMWWRRRRGAVGPIVQPVVPARDMALERLRALSEAGLLEKGDVKEYYERLTVILRQYAATVRPRWGTDLTTSELGAELRHDLPAPDALELLRILGASDLVKFARARPPADVARGDLSASERWVNRVGRSNSAAVRDGAQEAA